MDPPSTMFCREVWSLYQTCDYDACGQNRNILPISKCSSHYQPQLNSAPSELMEWPVKSVFDHAKEADSVRVAKSSNFLC